MVKCIVSVLVCFVVTVTCFAGPPPHHRGGGHHHHDSGLDLAAGIVNLVAYGLNAIFPTRSTVVVTQPTTTTPVVAAPVVTTTPVVETPVVVQQPIVHQPVVVPQQPTVIYYNYPNYPNYYIRYNRFPPPHRHHRR